MVTPQGFNALLKLVEEPPPHLKFIFATTEPEQGHRHHPLAHPPLPVPARAAARAAATTCRSSATRRASRSSRRCCRWWCARAPARSATRCPCSTSCIGGRRAEGVTYERAVGLLGYTDAALLDEVVDAFAADDGASVFELVDRVIEGGHRAAAVRRRPARAAPRPDHAARRARRGRQGLVDVPAGPGRADVGAGRAVRRRPSWRAPPTSSAPASPRCAAPPRPRLQLELICARVLLPGADPQAARGLGARVDRLERRLAIGAHRGSLPAAPAPARPRRLAPLGRPPASAALRRPPRQPEPAAAEPGRSPSRSRAASQQPPTG